MRINQLNLPQNSGFEGEMVIFDEPGMGQLRYEVRFRTGDAGEILDPWTSNSLPDGHLENVGDVVSLREVETQQVISLGALHNGKSSYPKYDAIHSCAIIDDNALLGELLESGYDPNYLHPENQATALHFAAGRGNLSAAQVLIAGDADLDSIDHNGLTPLKVALIEENWQVAELIVKAGANLSFYIPPGDTPLIHSVRHGALEVAKALLARGVDPLENNQHQELSAFYISIGKNRPEILKMFLESGIDPNTVIDTDSGATGLYFAVSERFRDCALVLLESGADPNRGIPGFTPIMLAKEDDDSILIDRLQQAGAH